jgi:multiple antibiotic resistance protein
MEPLFQIALTFFLVTNPIGNSPAIIALVKDYPFNRQRYLMLREGVFALLLALFFQYLGEHFLSLLHIKNYAVTLCGGTLLFLVALGMIFSVPENGETHALKQEPFIVPIATPLLSGAGLLTVIMLKSHEVQNNLLITGAILIAWIGVLLVLGTAPYLQKLLGKRGLLALEQLMGLVLAMIAVEMLVKGASMFRETIK